MGTQTLSDAPFGRGSAGLVGAEGVGAVRERDGRMQLGTAGN